MAADVRRDPPPPEPAAGQGGRRLASDWLARLSSLRGQLIIPYAVLTLLTAMLGIYVVTRLVTSTVRERFVNQIAEASRVAFDGVVRREQSHLRSLRLLVFTSGVAESMKAGDAEGLRALLLPVALNEQAQSVVALDLQGREILGLTRPLGTTQFEATQGSDFASEPLVGRVLRGEQDAGGDKFVGVIATSYGPMLYTSAPVRDEAEQLVGVMLFGTHLQTLVSDLKAESLADIVLQDPEGEVLASTFAEPAGPDAGYGLAPDQVAALDGYSTRRFEVYGRDYEGGYAPLIARQAVLGALGVALPSNFLVASESVSRTSFSVIFSLGTLAIIVVGYLLSQSISRPILRLRQMAQAVAAGDLNQASEIRRPDEIGDLAVAFDAMTDDLQARTAETERLYSEAIDRNRQLQEMYTRLQAAQQQLVQSEKLASVGQLSAGIVHDVKNPLGVIKGIAEELLEDLPANSQEAESLQVIRDNASRANGIVTDMLTFARQTPPAMLRRDLREVVEGSLRLTSYMLRKGKVELDLVVPDQPVMAIFDSQQIQQVIINLVQNAVQAMPDGGRLRVGLTVDDGMALVDVADTGTGIAPENLPRIFDPFFTTKPEGQGTGMGLSVSYGIVSRHNGTIDVESKLGEGSTFTVRLPKEASPMGQEAGAEA